MVHVEMKPDTAMNLETFLKNKGIHIWSGPITRLVTHMDLTEDDINEVIKNFKDFFRTGTPAGI